MNTRSFCCVTEVVTRTNSRRTTEFVLVVVDCHAHTLCCNAAAESHRASIPAVLMGRIFVASDEVDKRASRKYTLNALEGDYLFYESDMFLCHAYSFTWVSLAPNVALLECSRFSCCCLVLYVSDGNVLCIATFCVMPHKLRILRFSEMKKMMVQSNRSQADH